VTPRLYEKRVQVVPDREDAMLAERHSGTPKKTGALRYNLYTPN